MFLDLGAAGACTLAQRQTTLAVNWHNRSLSLAPETPVDAPVLLRKCRNTFLTLANYSLIAVATGLSRRQIERLLKRDLNCVPKRYYLEMRLQRARALLQQTAMPIVDITAACGFQSPPHFSKCYRSQFGYPPSAERKHSLAVPNLVEERALALQE